MRTLLCIIAAAVVLSGCRGVNYRFYRRGAPKRIDIERTATDPRPLATATRTDGSSVRLRLLEFREISLQRTKHYPALVSVGRHTGNPIWEPLELLLAPFMGFFDKSMVNQGGQNANFRGGIAHDLIILAISPAHSLFTARFTTKLAEGEPFAPRTSRRQYNMYLPLFDRAVRYRVLGDARNELASGSLVTDAHGVATIANIDGSAIGIELRTDDWSFVVPIEGEPRPVAVPPAAETPAAETPAAETPAAEPPAVP